MWIDTFSQRVMTQKLFLRMCRVFLSEGMWKKNNVCRVLAVFFLRVILSIRILV